MVVAEPIVLKIGPQDHGRRMSLVDYDNVEVVPGFHYELSNGVIEVSDVPSLEHAFIVRFIRKAIERYDDEHAGIMTAAFSGQECKTMIFETDTERHPDLSVYLTPAPNGGQVWKDWTPELVFEIVSESSTRRDYADKADDYWIAGVKEYVIVDRFLPGFRVLTRGQESWLPARNVKPDQIYTTPLLPGFELSVEKSFAAATPAK